MSVREDKQDATNDAQLATNEAQLVTNEEAVRRLIKLEQPPRLTLKEWGLIVLLFFISVVGVHQYDTVSANDAATAAATVVYKSQLKACHDTNPTRAAQHRYFATIALGRSTSAKHADAGRPTQKAVDQQIARVAYATAKAYTDRPGARSDGSLECRKTTVRP